MRKETVNQSTLLAGRNKRVVDAYVEAYLQLLLVLLGKRLLLHLKLLQQVLLLQLLLLFQLFRSEITSRFNRNGE